jgi:hypothetical protein
MKCVPGLQTFFDLQVTVCSFFVEVLGVLAPQNLGFKTVRPGPSPSGDASTAESTVARYK